MDDAGIDLPFPTRVIVKNAHDIPEAQERDDKRFKAEQENRDKSSRSEHKEVQPAWEVQEDKSSAGNSTKEK